MLTLSRLCVGLVLTLSEVLVANNNILYNAAFSGMVAAIEAGRMITGVNAGDYTEIEDTASIFADAVDDIIPTDDSLTAQDANLMLIICSQILGARAWRTDSTFVIANAIKALWTAARAGLLAVTDYGAQTQWAIDPATGNDSNVGTPASPLATMAEFNARMLLPTRVTVAATLQLVGNVTDAPLNLQGTRFGPGASLTVNGTRTPVTGATITITVVAGQGAGGIQPWLITTTGVDWTTVPVTSQVRLSTGHIAAIVEVVGANQVIIGAIGAAGTSVVSSAPTVGATITLSALSQALPPVINASGESFGLSQLILQDLSFIAGTSGTNGYSHTGGIQIQYYGCQMAMPSSNFACNTPLNLRCCRWTQSGSVNWRCGGDVITTYGHVAAGTGALLFNHQSGNASHSSITLNGARMFVTQCNATMSGHIRNTANPIVVQVNGNLSLQGIVSGANNTGIGVDVPSGTVSYTGANKPTITGGSDARVGGTTRTWAQIPFIAAQLDAIPPTVTTLVGNGAKIISE